MDHGIGRFEASKPSRCKAPHDCLLLIYAGNDRLFRPLKTSNFSRYGAEDNGTQLDRLGGGARQARKARSRNAFAKSPRI
jgi:transcription-repair coupling factor (superfamily II helicase)